MSDTSRPSPDQKPRTEVRPGGAATNAPAGATPPRAGSGKAASPASPHAPAGVESPPPGGQKPIVDDGTMPFKQTSPGPSGTTGPFSETIPEPMASEEAGTGRDPANFPGRDGGINDTGEDGVRMRAESGHDFEVSIPADPLAPRLTLRALSEGDAEKLYRDQAGIITTRHQIRAVRK